MCETTSVSPLLVFEDRDLKKGIVESWDSFVVEYLLKLVDNLRLKCFWAHWATSSRHGPLFTQQCYSPTRCYGKFGSHNGLDSSGEGYYLAVVSPVWPLKIPSIFEVNVIAGICLLHRNRLTAVDNCDFFLKSVFTGEKYELFTKCEITECRNMFFSFMDLCRNSSAVPQRRTILFIKTQSIYINPPNSWKSWERVRSIWAKMENNQLKYKL